ncbi:cytochrome P450 3A31 [Seiridium cupressi]
MATFAFFAKSVASGFIVYGLFLFRYRLLLHPLRKYPGSLLAKLSDVYGGYFAVLRRLHLRTYRGHLQYVLLSTPSCRHLGLDTIGQLGFGYDLKIQSEEEHRFLKKAIVFTNFRINLSLQLPALINFRPDLIASHLPNSIRKRLLAVVEKMIATRLAQPVDAKHDLLSFITPKLQTDLKDVQSGELWPEAVSFSGAEIRTTFKSADEIRGGPDLAGCRYLRGCIDESLRMASPVGTTLWRELGSREDGRGPLVVDGHTIPHGTLVGVNIYSLHHNEEYFPDPFVFRPERWLGDDADKARAAFTPFSVGSRTCAGKPLAYQEISLALAKTL